MTTQEVFEACINKQLELYDIGYDDVKKGGRFGFMHVTSHKKTSYLFGIIKGVKTVTKKIPWYHYYTFNSEQEYNNWKEYCINLFRTELKLTKKHAEQQFMWLDLNYGLKQNYEIPK